MIDKQTLLDACAALEAAQKKYAERPLFVAALAVEVRKHAKYSKVRVADVGASLTKHGIMPMLTPPNATTTRARRQAIKRADPERQLHFRQLRQAVPAQYEKLVQAAEGGSRTAAVKLHCLDCAGYVRSEVRHCIMAGSCPLWSIRPYQPRK